MPVPSGAGWVVLVVLAVLGLLLLPQLTGQAVNWLFGLLIGAVAGYVLDVVVPTLHQQETSPPSRR